MRSLYTYTEGLVRSSRRQRNLWFRRSEKAKERLKWPFVNAYLLSSSFSEFIRHPLLHKDDVARPMFDYLSEDGKIIVDCIGKIEAMAADFSKIAPRIGSPGLNLRQQNSSRPEGDELERFYRDQSDYDYVYERYQPDFVNFGYQKIELV